MSPDRRPAWFTALSAVLTEGPPTDRFAALATVDAAGQPRARLVVIRALLADPPRLQFTADLRSAKVAELTAQPRAELCWFAPSRWVQTRLTGAVSVAAAGRQAAWTAMSVETRGQFFGGASGHPLGGPPPLGAPTDAAPPAHFGLLTVLIDAVDVVDLSSGAAQRTRWHLSDAGWSATALNP